MVGWHEAELSEADKMALGNTHADSHSWEQPRQKMLMDREDKILEFLIYF